MRRPGTLAGSMDGGGGSAGAVYDSGEPYDRANSAFPDDIGTPDDEPGASELKSWIRSKARKALNRGESEESNRRVDLYDRYLGEAYGDEEDGYSKLVTRECFESVLWAKPELLRVFLSTSKIVEFVPRGPEDEEAAEQETDVVNYMMRQRREAYSAFRDWVIDFLIYPTAYIKIWWDDAQRWDESHYEQQTAEQVAALQMMNPGLEVVRVMDAEPHPEMPGVPLYDITVRQLNPYKTGLRIESVPPEEVLVDNLWTKGTLEECRFVCHYREIERTDLVAMGYPRDLVDSLQTSRALSWTTERVNRRRFETEQSWSSEFNYDGTDTIEVYECYANYDFDDDGYAELRYMFIAGDTLLENYRTDYQPFCAARANPLPHRHLGLSMIEVVADIQRRATTLTRQMHDNLYRTNRPRQFVPPGVNMDQMMNYVPHGTVAIDGEAPVPEVVPVAVDKVLPALDKIQEEHARRTGVSPGATTLDPDVLAKTTMGAYMAALEKNNGPFEMMVRDWAEEGVSVAASKVHQLLQQHQAMPMTVRLRNEWVQVNPAEWSQRSDMVPLVGLGTGNREQRIAEARLMAEAQVAALPYGLTTPDRMYRALEDFTGALGKTAPSLYFVDPSSEEGQALAQQRAQSEQEQSAQMQQAAMAQIQVAMTDIEQRTMRELAKLRQDYLKHLDKQKFDYTKLEVENAVDVPGEGMGKTIQ